MDKAIDTLESLREYLENKVRPSCEYYIYSNLIDITDKAIAELEYKAKFQELEADYNQLTQYIDIYEDKYKTRELDKW